MTSPDAPVRKVGVEAELLLVDPDAGELRNVADHALHEHRSGADDRRAGVVTDVVARTEDAAR